MAGQRCAAQLLDQSRRRRWTGRNDEPAHEHQSHQCSVLVSFQATSGATRHGKRGTAPPHAGSSPLGLAISTSQQVPPSTMLVHASVTDTFDCSSRTTLTSTSNNRRVLNGPGARVLLRPITLQGSAWLLDLSLATESLCPPHSQHWCLVRGVRVCTRTHLMSNTSTVAGCSATHSCSECEWQQTREACMKVNGKPKSTCQCVRGTAVSNRRAGGDSGPMSSISTTPAWTRRRQRLMRTNVGTMERT